MPFFSIPATSKVEGLWNNPGNTFGSKFQNFYEVAIKVTGTGFLIWENVVYYVKYSRYL
jgi:hypothetical protein